jgi:hypothetical protein
VSSSPTSNPFGGNRFLQTVKSAAASRFAEAKLQREFVRRLLCITADGAPLLVRILRGFSASIWSPDKARARAGAR